MWQQHHNDGTYVKCVKQGELFVTLFLYTALSNDLFMLFIVTCAYKTNHVQHRLVFVRPLGFFGFSISSFFFLTLSFWEKFDSFSLIFFWFPLESVKNKSRNLKLRRTIKSILLQNNRSFAFVISVEQYSFILSAADIFVLYCLGLIATVIFQYTKQGKKNNTT